MEENPWQFVHVDPLAPKKRRKRRKLDPIEAQRSGQEAYRPREDTRFRKEPIGRVKIPGHTTAQAFKCVATSSSGDSPLARHVEQEEEAEESWATPLRQGVLQPSAIECGQLDDFDRYCLYSNGTRYDTSTASTIWCSLGVNTFFMWTPLAGSIIENSLFHYYATESVSASVSFDGAYNLFRIALLPLVSSEPILFHGAIAVAGVHWANKLKGVRRNLGQLDANGQQQLEILQLASEYHRRIAVDLNEAGKSVRQRDQKSEETSAAALVLFDTWRTFSDGIATREATLGHAVEVVKRYRDCPVTPVGRFLRMMTCWLDPLDGMAHRRASTVQDAFGDVAEAELVNSAVRYTSGCDTSTLRLISATTTLGACTTPLTTWLNVQLHSAQAINLQAQIMALVIDKPRDLETDLAASAFNLALVLYFHTHVLQSSLSHPTVVWAVGRLLELAERAQCLGYRQAWATWPYFMLGLHVSDPIHRQAVQARFRWMEETISIGNLFALREVLSELWDRRDRCEPVEWQQVSLEVRGGIVSPL